MAGIKDRYANKAYISVTESGANTLTFSEIQTGMAMFEKVAWLIHRIEWWIGDVARQELTAVTDFLTMALVGNNTMASLSLGDQAVYDIIRLGVVDMGVAASGGGLIIAPRPLYAAVQAGGFAAAAIVSARIYFTYLELKAEEYWELVEATRMIV